MNAETSAWGRAIIALGASDSKAGIASREEVRNRQAEREEPKPPLQERVAKGRMSTAEVREHGKLRDLSETHPRPADRSAGPLPDDEWTTPPESVPGSSSDKQRQILGILFAGAGIRDRDDRINATRSMLGKPDLTSSKDLSYAQAEDLIAQLRNLITEQEKEGGHADAAAQAAD
jgi:hypothetical protein